MTTFFDSYRLFPFNNIFYRLNKIEENMKRKILLDEISSKRSAVSIRSETRDILMRIDSELRTVENEIKGFNWNTLFVGLCFAHIVGIYTRKTLLSEMHLKDLGLHLAFCSTAGLIAGFIPKAKDFNSKGKLTRVRNRLGNFRRY